MSAPSEDDGETPSVSVVTPVRNRAMSVASCLTSVAAQVAVCSEHVVIDGGSSDGTVEVVQGHAVGYFRSAPDEGLYDALNRGIQASRGDVIGVLGADDVYADAEVLRDVVQVLEANACDAVYGDLLYTALRDPTRVVRTWRAGPLTRQGLQRGWMPPHPALFVRREVYERLGYYNTTLRIAADYEFMVRCMTRGVRFAYLPRVLVRMRLGGVSNQPRKLLQKSWEDLRALRLNGVPNPAGVVLLKNLRKLPQFLPALLGRGDGA